VKRLDWADGARLIDVRAICLRHLDDIASVAEFRIVAIWSDGIVIDCSCIEAIDDIG